VRLLERESHSGLWRGRAWKTSIRNNDALSRTAARCWPRRGRF
jgi:hypothetical protein